MSYNRIPMIYTFVSLLLIIVLTLIVTMVHSIRQKNKISSPTTAFIWQNILLTVSYLCTFFISDPKVVRILYDFTMSAIIWYLFFFSYFLSIITKTQFAERIVYKSKWLKKFVKIQEKIPAVISILDCILLILDVRFQFLFSIIKASQIGPYINCWRLVYSPLFPIHLCIYSIFMTVIILLAVRKIFTVNFLFRKTYLTLGFTLVILIFLNFFNMFTTVRADVAFLCYGFISIYFWYYAFYSLPSDQNHYLLTLFSDSIHSAIACFDKDENCIYSNKMCQELFEGRTSAITTKNIETYLVNSWYYNFKSNAVSGDEKLTVNGEERYFRVEHQKLFDSENRFTGSFFKLYETTDEINKIKQAKFRATYDELTGLYNRRTFFEKVEELIQATPEIPRYMIVTNIFNYSLLNDLFGSRLGETVIKRQAEMLSYAKYDDVLFGRISSDKCAMLIRTENFKKDLAEQNTQIIQKITNSLNYKLKIYIGVYEILNSEESAVSMCDKAILAINSIRGDYEQTIAFYNSTMMEGILKQRSILSEFSRALRSNEFHMYMQPVTDKKGNCISAETLVRWQHPLIGLLAPNYFIESLENSGYIYALDSLMWTMAAQKLKEWQNKGFKDLSISVNISSKDFMYADLYIVFTDLVEKYQVPPNLFILEIQEDVLKTNADRNIEFINSLCQYGFTVVLDSFGNDMQTLQLLKQLDVSGVKFCLNKNNIQTTNETFEKYIKSLFKLVKDLNLSFTAVGIEKEEQLNMLSKLGCKQFQGYYFDKPLSIADFERKYTGGNNHD